MIDILSYILGFFKGKKSAASNVVIEEGGDYTFSDTGHDGNVVIAES